MRFGSVCSGIEAASVAWGPLGWMPAWLSEVERFPCAVLAHHYPDVPNLGDMRHVAAMLRAGALEAPDVLCGGTPCQAFSVAGLRRSLADDRGNLSLVFCEIANAIDDARQTPCIVVWENVPGVLSTVDNAFGCFLAGLAGEDDALQPSGHRWSNAGCVYGPRRTVAWRILDAQYFGLAQRRKRVFVVASARDDFDPAEVLFEWEGVRRDSAPSRGTGEGAASGAGRGAQERGDVVGAITSGAHPGGYNGQDAYTGHLLAFGGNNTSGPIDVAAGLNGAGGSGRMDFESETFVAHALRGEGFDASEDGTGRGTPLVTFHAEAQPDEMRFDPHATAALTASQHAAVAFMTRGSNVDVGDISGTFGANSDRASGSAPMVSLAAGVRRLTPEECEALQGFPRSYTAIPGHTADGPRYRALGNSWPVPVITWIGRRIAAQLQ